MNGWTLPYVFKISGVLVAYIGRLMAYLEEMMPHNVIHTFKFKSEVKEIAIRCNTF